MVEPLRLLSNNALETIKALFCKGLKLSGNKPLVLGSIKETEEPFYLAVKNEIGISSGLETTQTVLASLTSS